ncbi:MAG: macro domain-containing protein [Gemmatimonadota bacterium]
MADGMHAVRADITTLEVDAVVNAANSSLLGGGGVDGAIHRAAGPAGEARITGGDRLPARHVIHTVGPVWRGGDEGEAELLASCYRSALALAADHELETVAFPAISCGIYGYPIREAAHIAVRECRAFLKTHPSMEVTFALFGEEELAVYGELLTGDEAG